MRIVYEIISLNYLLIAADKFSIFLCQAIVQTFKGITFFLLLK